MGQDQSGTRKSDQPVELSGDALLRKLNDLSGGDKRSTSHDTINFTGINRYLNQKAGITPDTSLPDRKDIIGSVSRYKDIQELVGRNDLDFSATEQTKLLSAAYDKINRNPNRLRDFGALENGKIEHPRNAQKQETTVSNNSRQPTTTHERDVVQRLDKLLENPHSYLSLSQTKREDLLKLSGSELASVLHRDETFVKETSKSWVLPDNERADTQRKVREEYTEELCHKITESKQTNKAPTAAFMAGEPVLERAVGMGFDVFDKYSGEPKLTSLTAFGNAAQTINLAKDPVSTQLSGRVDSQFSTHDDPTGMTFKNDDVLKSNAVSKFF